MIKINLISDIQEKKVQTKKLNTYVTIGAVTVVGIAVGAILIIWGVVATEKIILASTNKKIQSTNSELAKYADLEKTVISLEKGLTGVKQVLDGKYQWTKLLPHIEAATPNDIKFNTLKLSDGAISADLQGKDTNSLARFIESFKNYSVIVISGSGTQGDNVSIQNGDQVASTNTKTSGTWVTSLAFDSTKDQNFTIVTKKSDGSDGGTSKVTYSASDKKITPDSGISAKTENLFTAIDSKGYTVDTNGKIKFSVTMNFDGGAIW